MQTIYIDLSNKMVLPTIYAKQGDIGRKFEVVLTDSGVPYTIPKTALFSVWYNGDSGEGNYTDIGETSAFSVSSNRVVVEMITQMLSNAGNGTLCLVMNQGEKQIGSWNVPYICETVPGAESEAAKSYYTAFSAAVEKAKAPDTSLTLKGYPADAKATGDKIKSLTYSDVGAAPGGYGYGGSAIYLTSSQLASDEELNTALEPVFTEMNNYETKMIYFKGYPSTGSFLFFGILAKSSSSNGTLFVQSTFNYGRIYTKVKRSGTWTALEPISLQSHPVGSIYTSTSSTSPAGIFGGIWEQLENMILVGAGSALNAGTAVGSISLSTGGGGGSIGRQAIIVAEYMWKRIE